MSTAPLLKHGSQANAFSHPPRRQSEERIDRFSIRYDRELGPVLERFSHRGVGGVANSRLDRGSDTRYRESMFDDPHSREFLDGDFRRRAIALSDDNAICRGMIERATEHIIGGGIRPQAMTKSKRFNREAEARFRDWAEGEADVREQGGLYEHLQPMWLRESILAGDTGIVLLKSGRLQTIDGLDIDTPPGKAGDKRVAAGVKLSPLGLAESYFVRRADSTSDFAEISAKDFILFAQGLHRPKDTRGDTLLRPSIKSNLFDMIDGNLEAVVAASQMAAMFGIITKTLEGLDSDIGQTVPDAQGRERKRFAMEPGMVTHLQPGEDVTQLNPNQPSQNYVEFLAMCVRFLGLPLGLPLELVLMDFSRTNFSSARAAMLVARKNFERHQQRMIHKMRRIWRWRISKWMKDGELPDRSDAFSHHWMAPAYMHVDPEKELQAEAIGLDIGATTLGRVLSRLGIDLDDFIVERKAELEKLKAAGIPTMRSNKTREPGAAGKDQGNEGSRDQGSDGDE